MMDWLLPDLNDGLPPVWPRIPTPPPQPPPPPPPPPSHQPSTSVTTVTSDALLADLLSSVGPSIPNTNITTTTTTTTTPSTSSTPPLQIPNTVVIPSSNDKIKKIPTARESRAIRRREFHKIHTRRSRAKLNDKMDKLLSVLPAPPPGVVIKSKAQILDYAITVFEALHPRPKA